MAPQIKTYSEIVSQMLSSIGERTGLTNFNVGSVIRTLTEVFSEVVGELYAFGAEMLKQGFLDTATEIWLDRKAKEYGLERKPAIKTAGSIIYSRPIAKNTNISIPTGSIVTTPKDQSGKEYRFFTTEDAILESGQISVQVAVIAESAGSTYNVGPTSISRMKTYINGIASVSNETDWITVVGVDEEKDSALRQRCFLAWEELSQGGTAAAYISWALSVPGVKSTFVDDSLPRGEGTVNIYIMGEAGPPDAALIESVQVLIDAKRPITADAWVLSPDIVPVIISMSVTPRSGYDPAPLEQEIRRRLAVYFGDIEDTNLPVQPLGVGKDVVVSRLVSLSMNVQGVYMVEVNMPATNVVIAPNEFPEQGTVTIIMEAASNE